MGVKINFALVITRIEIKVLLIRLKKLFGNANMKRTKITYVRNIQITKHRKRKSTICFSQMDILFINVFFGYLKVRLLDTID